MMLLLIVVLATLAVSATCSLLEATLMSTRMPTLEAAVGGPHGAAASRLLEMKRNIAAPTSAILILNTIANTAGATLAGSIAVDVFGTGALGLFSVLFTIAVLFLAEIGPKTLGAVQWRAIWRFIVWPLAGMQRALGPVVWMTEKVATLLVGGRQIKPTTEGEIVAMIRLGAKVGELSRTELDLMTSVLRFDEMRVSEVMVPRREVQSIRLDATVREALVVMGEHLHTRYPLHGGALDDATQLVHLKDLANPKVDPETPVRELARSLRHVPGTMAISSLLRQMQRTRQHMALVVDEFGTAVGLVTLENLLEEIVGAVQDEFDQELPASTPAEGGARVFRGSTPLRVVSAHFETELTGQRVETLNGWVLEQLGRLPKTGDVLHEGGLALEVLEVRRDQATQIRITPSEDEPEDAAEAAPSDAKSP